MRTTTGPLQSQGLHILWWNLEVSASSKRWNILKFPRGTQCRVCSHPTLTPMPFSGADAPVGFGYWASLSMCRQTTVMTHCFVFFVQMCPGNGPMPARKLHLPDPSTSSWCLYPRVWTQSSASGWAAAIFTVGSVTSVP